MVVRNDKKTLRVSSKKRSTSRKNSRKRSVKKVIKKQRGGSRKKTSSRSRKVSRKPTSRKNSRKRSVKKVVKKQRGGSRKKSRSHKTISHKKPVKKVVKKCRSRCLHGSGKREGIREILQQKIPRHQWIGNEVSNIIEQYAVSNIEQADSIKLEELKEHVRTGGVIRPGEVNEAAKNGHLETLKWIRANGEELTKEAADARCNCQEQTTSRKDPPSSSMGHHKFRTIVWRDK